MLFLIESPKKMQKIFTSVVEGVSSWSGIKLFNSAWAKSIPCMMLHHRLVIQFYSVCYLLLPLKVSALPEDWVHFFDFCCIPRRFSAKELAEQQELEQGQFPAADGRHSRWQLMFQVDAETKSRNEPFLGEIEIALDEPDFWSLGCFVQSWKPALPPKQHRTNFTYD